MIKYECNEGTTTLEIKGTASELYADVALFLRTFYRSILEEDKDAADFFEFVIRNHISDIVFSDIEDLRKEVEAEKTKKAKKEEKKGDIKLSEKDLNELINTLTELSDFMHKMQ